MGKSYSKLVFVVFLVSSLLSSTIFAQNLVSEEKYELDELSDYKNTLRWNLTPFVLFGYKNLNFGYERVLSNKNTASINIGYLEIPILFSSSESVVYKSGKDKRSGFSAFIDYNFYISNRNKRNAPEGVYWGIYTGYYNQSLSNTFKVYESDALLASADLSTEINNLNIGVQMGYQFVFNDRFTLDLVLIGPSASIYFGDIQGEIELHDTGISESEIWEYYSEVLTEGLPNLVSDLDAETIYRARSGSNFSTIGKGFRYTVQIGYRF